MTRHSATEADAKEAINVFGLRRESVSRAIEASEHNDDFLVQGEGSTRFLLRCYRRDSKPDRVRFELSFERALHGLGFPTPSLTETADGTLMHVNASGIWAFFEFVPGEHYDQSPDGRVEEIGKRLAQFHLLGERLDMPETSTPVDLTL